MIFLEDFSKNSRIVNKNNNGRRVYLQRKDWFGVRKIQILRLQRHIQGKGLLNVKRSALAP